jgi:hypothetical protein
MPKRRSDTDSEVIAVLRARVKNLEKRYEALEMESIQRGVEITNLIQIFNICEDVLPEGPHEMLRKIALGWAGRDRNVQNRKKLKFEDARQGDYAQC